ncbi:MAG: RluA family pseudouridine synthase [Oscillospiraceae bacterium]|jgi:23S rRNA pseudouridine955/2504/2580 synthase|nr:RluA family pseudouridine synthase [Oscillospiraceae bacterium]
MKEFLINQNDAAQRLDRFTAKAAPLLPASLAQKYIRIKRIKVNGKGAKRDYKLAVGDFVQMYVNDEFFENSDDENAYLKISDPSLEIVYEDDNIMLINKPIGVLCHSDSGYDYSCVISRVQAYLYKSGQWRPREESSFTPALCNRIDRNTSGIVIAAKNAESLRILNEKFKIREIDKYYLAVVHGIPKSSFMRLEGFIFKDSVKNRVYVTKHSSPGAKTAVMEYRTLETTIVNTAMAKTSESSVENALSLLECRLITGRTHQIRAQLADIGHPLLGDGKYGSTRLDKIYGETKQVLCSYKLVFDFKTDAGQLSYLNGQTFKLHSIPFVEKYFSK